MSSTELLALADKCERHSAIGRWDIVQDSSRELNEAIAIAIGLPATAEFGHPSLGNYRRVPSVVLNYVGSLDAAMNLVSHEMGVSVSRHGKRNDDCLAYVGKSDSDARGNFMTETSTGEAKTMALAVCAAALRARNKILNPPTKNGHKKSKTPASASGRGGL